MNLFASDDTDIDPRETLDGLALVGLDFLCLYSLGSRGAAGSAAKIRVVEVNYLFGEKRASCFD